ncbi:hypothetical protein ABVK25_011938 [Lepraria finkii]|uniref:Tryptophan halogenase n=1 Tax=Lepraria finkii TaxID=1340010 RepID=A0ABR4AMH5_9LECA
MDSNGRCERYTLVLESIYSIGSQDGAAFKLNQKKREGWTDYVAAGGPEAYTWNVVRSESDDLTFRHAGKMGAKIFDGVKIESIDFSGDSGIKVPEGGKVANLGRPVSADWKRKDGTTGSIKFEYVIDASGRAGIVSNKYYKNRKFNQGLKNVAQWGYWENTGVYAEGTRRHNQPFFEALTDASGWAWFIPLHNGTTSVGTVQRQDLSTQKKKALGSPSSVDFYKESLKLAPTGWDFISKGELVSDIKHASDWSYSASAYSSPYTRIAGDAGCFIDPYFSSGVHLAYAAGLSAAMTIRAVQRGDVDELTAAKWHSNKVAEGYTRFLLVVMSATKQIRGGEQNILSDWDDDGFDIAFDAFRPIIQGTADADVSGKLTHEQVVKTVDFCLEAYKETSPEQRKAVLDKVATITEGNAGVIDEKANLEKLTEDELKILNHIRAKQMLRFEDTLNLNHYGADAIDGLVPNLKTGKLGLVPEGKNTLSKLEVPTLDLLDQVKDKEPEPIFATA